MTSFDVDELPGKTIQLVWYDTDRQHLNLSCTDGFYI